MAALTLGPGLLLAQETTPAAPAAESSAPPATQTANPNWSADMLTNLLKEPAKPQTPVAPDEGSSSVPTSSGICTWAKLACRT
jgi:hypothetical protein